MSDPEITLLMEKAKTNGLTYEEKARLYLLTSFTSNSQPKCRCFKRGEECRLHGKSTRHEIPYTVDCEL